ncbi:DedA [Richelia sinica FACHB-800]|uniref:TVP38/TMEM64 family membrane protein n=1 Tax=Richelia sinica FACHB-800 TaxID=1357546 RepID=A0A975Y6I5_9NOST|nr:TVP38/TMEM64 family protein [Richelia sinica]MBD2664768.1 TVP38/TMEM64 family protein [Richelia sinica FACHB-800]QXE25318.1 DedA [Richelia sinica FACHB-800]
MPPNYQLRLNKIIKLICLSCFVVIALIVSRNWQVLEHANQSILWIQSLGKFAPIVFIFCYNIATILFIPGSIMTLKGGFLFGLFWGSIYVFIAAVLGAICAFLIGRYLSRDWVNKQLEKHPRFQAIDAAVAQAGWKIVLLTRLSPVFPFNLLNYAFGVTQVSLKDYVLGSFGIIPGTLLYVYMGSLVNNISMLDLANESQYSETKIFQLFIKIIGFLATLVVTIYITKIAQKAINTKISNNELATLANSSKRND